MPKARTLSTLVFRSAIALYSLLRGQPFSLLMPAPLLLARSFRRRRIANANQVWVQTINTNGKGGSNGSVDTPFYIFVY